jgi:hypothetical protein
MTIEPGNQILPAISRNASLGEARLIPALLVLVAVVYWSGLHGGFVFDDYPNIVDNVALHVTWNSTWPQWLAAIFSSPASDMQRPLAMATFAVNHALTGLDPYWMKLTNLGIHLLNTVLVFGLVNRVLQAADDADPARPSARRELIALWVAAAWALNPINLMAVLLVVQRMEILCHTFVFAGLWLYLAGRARLQTSGRGWTLLLTGLIGGTALGVLAKESAVLLPVYALALEWALLRFTSNSRGRDHRLQAVFALVLVLPGLIGLTLILPNVLNADAYAGRNFNIGERLMTEGRVLVDYLHWTLLPDLGQLSLYHDDYPVSHGLLTPPGTLVALMLLAGLLGAMVWLRKRRPLMALGLAWFFAAHLLTATVIPLELMFEHRNYFASLGLCLALADGLLRMFRVQAWGRVSTIAAIVLLLLYTGLTTLRAREWHDPLRFSLTEAAKHPMSPRATYDVARNFIILSDYKRDSPYMASALAALQQAMRVPNATTLPETAAILLAARAGMPVNPDWWLGLQHKLQDRPVGLQQTASLGALMDCQLRHECQLTKQDMVNTFLAALQQGPNAEVLNIYGNYAFNVLHDPVLALRLWYDAAKLAHNFVQSHVTLGRLLIASGRPDLAGPYIAKVRQLGRWGQNDALAHEMEQLAEQESRRHPSSTPAVPVSPKSGPQ